MGAAAMAMTHPQRMLKHHLYSLLREELLSYGFPQVCCVLLPCALGLGFRIQALGASGLPGCGY